LPQLTTDDILPLVRIVLSPEITIRRVGLKSLDFSVLLLLDEPFNCIQEKAKFIKVIGYEVPRHGAFALN
jgi:hypothetical protein